MAEKELTNLSRDLDSLAAQAASLSDKLAMSSTITNAASMHGVSVSLMELRRRVDRITHDPNHYRSG